MTPRKPSQEQLLTPRPAHDVRVAEQHLKLLRVALLSSPFISDPVCRDGFVGLVDRTAKLLGFDLTVRPGDNHHIRFLADLPVGCDPEEPDDVTTN